MPFFTYQGHRCHYEDMGEGRPLLLLHGNTASSRMFEGIAQEYADTGHRVLVPDFLGHGRSERLARFPVDLWFDEAMQVVELMRQLDLPCADLIGTSGGALVALNVALEAPERVNHVVADSFEGPRALKAVTETLACQRAESKSDQGAIAFYTAMHGEDWEGVVDNDTAAALEHFERIGSFFHRPLSELRCQLLLTGSREDEFVSALGADFFDRTYGAMLEEIGHGKSHLFETGCHPAMLSSAEEFLALSGAFLEA